MIPYPKIFLVLAIIIGVTFAAHIFIRRVFRASLIAAVTSGVVITVVAYFQEGDVNAVPFMMGGLYTFIFALIVGLFFYLGRKYL